MKFIGYNGEIEFTDYFIRIRKSEKSASRIFYPLVIDTITLVKPTLTKVGYIYVRTGRGKHPSEIDCKRDPNAICFKKRQYKEAKIFKEELDKTIQPEKRSIGFRIIETRPLQVPEEIWNDVNSLSLFCLGVFDEWETKALEELINSPYSDGILSKEDYLLLEMHSMLKSHFGRRKYNTPSTFEYTNAEIELSAPEILLMRWINGKDLESAFNPPQYFSYDYFLDITEVLSRLYSAGYITYSNIEYGINKLTITDLKPILKQHNLKVGGKKADLVDSVLKNVPIESLKYLDKRYIVATDKGKKCIEENDFLAVFQWDRTIGISPIEAYEYKLLHPNASRYDIEKAFHDKHNAGLARKRH